MGHFDKAIEMHKQCLAIMKKVGDYEGQTDIVLILFSEVSSSVCDITGFGIA
jgi:hypothetical protein